MDNEPVGRPEFTPQPPHNSRRRWIRILLAVVIVTLIGAALVILVPKFINTTTKDDTKTEKLLTIDDLDNPDVDVDDASDASIENLTKQLKAKIDKQIAAKENPFETVKQLAGILFNTTNQKRQDQTANFLEDFLAKHEDSLHFNFKSETPDKAQVNYWKAQLYALLVYNYNSISENKFTDASGKVLDTTQQQLKYIDLYLALANDPESRRRMVKGDISLGYDYDYIDDLLEIKAKLTEQESGSE